MKKEKKQGLTYCRPEYKGKPQKGKTSLRYCCACGMRVRGDNHYEGSHHLKRSEE